MGESGGHFFWSFLKLPLISSCRLQTKILAHPKVNIVISHGGWGSIAEILSEAIPMVLFPLDGDHPSGCKVVAKAGAGLCLATVPGQTFSAADLVQCLHSVSKDSKFHESCLRLREAVLSAAANWPYSLTKPLAEYLQAERLRLHP